MWTRGWAPAALLRTTGGDGAAAQALSFRADFTVFRAYDLVAFATALAKAENVAAVIVLCERHPAVLRPALQTILESFPETVSWH
jgi:hypothetical protein